MAVSANVIPVLNTATQLSPTPTDQQQGSSVIVANNGAATVYLGGPGVTAATGFPLAAGAAITVDLVTDKLRPGDPGTAADALWGITASATVNVNVLAAGV